MFPRTCGYAQEFRVFEDEEIDDGSFGIEESDHAVRALEEARRKGYDLVYGDKVRIGNSTFRNSGVMIYDGEKLIHLDYNEKIYQYGFVPEEFTVIKHKKTDEEVPLFYYGFSDEIRFPTELLQDLNFSEDKRIFDENDDPYYTLSIKDHDMMIVYPIKTNKFIKKIQDIVPFLNFLIHEQSSIILTHYSDFGDGCYLPRYAPEKTVKAAEF